MASKYLISEVERVLTHLNTVKTRCTYTALGEYLGANRRDLGEYLGNHRPEASWVVLSNEKVPSGYKSSEMHPDLFDQSYIIRTGEELRQSLKSS